MQISKYQNAKNLLNLSNGWVLKQFDELLKDVTRTGTKIPSSNYEEVGQYPVIDQGKELIAGYSNLENPIEGDKIIFGDHTRVLKYIDFDSFHIGADGVKVLENKMPEKVSTKYIYYYLTSIEIPNTGYNRHFKYLKEIVIPVPSFEIQLKLVELFDHVKSLMSKRQSQIEALDELTQSVFLEMFGDPKSHKNKFDKKPLSEFGEIITGNTPSRKVKEYYGDYIEWIKSDNINTPYHFLTKAEEYLSTEGIEKGRVVPKNSILVTCIAGSKSCIGNAAIADREVAFNQQINAIIPNGNPFFLYTQFLVGKELIQSASTDGMKGLVSKGAFQQVEFIFPPKELQDAFGNKFLTMQKQKQKLLMSYQKLEGLYYSLLQKAFKGELFQLRS